MKKITTDMYKVIEIYKDKKGIRIFVGEDRNKDKEIYVVKKYKNNSFDSLTLYSDPTSCCIRARISSYYKINLMLKNNKQAKRWFKRRALNLIYGEKTLKEIINSKTLS